MVSTGRHDPLAAKVSAQIPCTFFAWDPAAFGAQVICPQCKTSTCNANKDPIVVRKGYVVRRVVGLTDFFYFVGVRYKCGVCQAAAAAARPPPPAGGIEATAATEVTETTPATDTATSGPDTFEKPTAGHFITYMNDCVATLSDPMRSLFPAVMTRMWVGIGS